MEECIVVVKAMAWISEWSCKEYAKTVKERRC